MEKMTMSSTLLRSLVFAAVMAWALPSRADIPPACDAFDALITCAAADVGKACQGGGQCYAVSCGTSTGMTLYKCDACPAILSAPDAGCAPASFGTACGDGGTCSTTPAYCNTSAMKYVCSGPAPTKPTGPPAGEAGGSGGGGGSAAGGHGGSGQVADCPACKSSGCDLAPRATGPGAIALGLLAVGMAALLVDRRRRRKRRP
jgi:hypothetical protein